MTWHGETPPWPRLVRSGRKIGWRTSPKGYGLERGSWYAPHCAVEGNDGGAGDLSVRGVGQRVMDPAVWESVRPGHPDE
jgi:hypothetical protein